mgnify:CR=1 FL=1
MKKGYRQLIINPGSTSTKLAVFSEEEKLMQENIEHSPEELAGYEVSKGTIRLPYDRPLPADLIRRIAGWCFENYAR